MAKAILVPTANGYFNNWTASSGTRWEAVLSEDALYCHCAAADPAESQTFVMSDMVVPTSTPIIAVRVYTSAMWTVSAAIKHLVSTSGGTPDTPLTRSLTASYTWASTLHPNSPGSSGWTVTQVNDAQAGMVLDPDVGTARVDRIYMEVEYPGGGGFCHFVAGLIGAAGTLTQVDWQRLFRYLARARLTWYTRREQQEAVREVLNHPYPRYYDLGGRRWVSPAISLPF